jgi:hypothetical protein
MAAPIIYLDERPFKFECAISTGSNRGKADFIGLSQSGIVYLEIKESIFNGFPEGHLVVDSINSGLDSTVLFNGNNFANFLYLKIRPVIVTKGGMSEDIGKDENFNIEELFCIYKVEDIPVGEYPQMNKKLYFRHILANELSFKKNSFTAIDFAEEEDISSRTDNERSIKTGDILKKLFGTDKKDRRGAGFVINEDEWDAGKNTMFPNWCPSTETLFDSIQRVYKRHVSEFPPHDKCYLKYNRGTSKKSLSLISMAQLLKKNIDDPDNYFMETLSFGSYSESEEIRSQDESQRVQLNIKKPIINSSDSLLDLSNIRSFKLYDLSSEILEKDFTINIPAITDFDNTTRFNLGEADIKSIYENSYKKYYIDDPFSTLIEGGSPLPMVAWDSFRHKVTTEYNKVIHTPFKTFDQAFDVEVNANILSTLLFKSLRCTVSVRGATHRTIGKFIDVELKDVDPTLKYIKIPGRWLVTECYHIFSKERYWNSLNCIKTYRNF